MALYSSRVAYVYRQPGNPVPDFHLPPGYEFVSLDQGSIDALFSAPEDAARYSRYVNFWSGGSQGTAVVYKNQWAAVGWYTLPDSQAGPPHVPPHFFRGRYWLFHAHTAEPFRRQGLQKALVAHRIRQIRERSSEKVPPVFTDVKSDNTPSQRAQTASGFVRAGNMHFRTFDNPRLKTRTLVTWPRSLFLPREKA